MIRTIIFGAGRMARSMLSLAGEYPDVEIVALVSRNPPPDGVLPPRVPFFDALDAAAGALEENCDLLIDFTLPEGTREAASWCAEHRTAMLSGVTALDDSANRALNNAAQSVPVLWAANLSPGVNLMAEMLRGLGESIGPAAPVRIEDVHHEGKKDAPSGTALYLARALRKPSGGAGHDPKHIADDFPGIEFHSRREGAVVGDHLVSIHLLGESLTLAHHAEDRRLFARGAYDAGQWLIGQPPGKYTATDWIRGKKNGT
jgi:4-hydroxy-tetrahydrodipicolinate reductase